MKRIRIARCTGQLLKAQTRASTTSSLNPIPYRAQHVCQPKRLQSSSAAIQRASFSVGSNDVEAGSHNPLPSPHPTRAQSSAKLAALHARLSLPENLPLETLARALVDPSADSNPNFNNANLAFLGGSLISYHASEKLVCQYPRLPMAILFEAMRSYGGPESLYRIAKQWGVESAAAPGEEVDPGLLQWSQDPSTGVKHTKWGYVRKESNFLDKFKWRRGMSSRVVMDDEFGDPVHKSVQDPMDPTPEDASAAARAEFEGLRNNASAAFVRAVIGAVYLHSGRESVKSFINAHLLSRKFSLHQLFKFKLPTRELAMLCAREGFEKPVARLLSETGRLSRTPVFVVGIFSGNDKLGEGTGPSLDVARVKAAMHSLKSWYLYSPGAKVNLPSDALIEGSKPYRPVHIDMGEII